jgi:DNA repair protein RadC
MKNSALASETFSRGKNHFFFDLRRAVNQSNFFCFTKSILQADQSYKRETITIYDQDIENFITAISSLLHAARYIDRQDVTVHQLREEQTIKNATGIKAIDPALRPREKLATTGAWSLTNAELLALLIGSGSADESAIELGARIMSLVGDDPRGLSGLNFYQLCLLKGVGLAKASAVLSAIELSYRMQKQEAILRPVWGGFRKDGQG